MLGLFKRGSEAAPKMETLNSPATLCAGRMEYPCVIRQASRARMTIVLSRTANIAGSVIVVDHVRGLALDARIDAIKGLEVGLDITASHNLAGLVPARLSRARDLWKRS